MGILADIFLSTPADAINHEELEDDLQVAGPFDFAQYGYFTGQEFPRLWAILEGSAWDAQRHRLEPVSDGEFSWLERFPDAFVTLLAGLDPATSADAVRAWALAEEPRREAADLMPVAADLQRLAIEAGETGKSLYLWGCR